MAETSPVSGTDDGVTVAIRVTPKAGRQKLEGVVTDANGRPAIRVAVTALPQDGKANKAVIALLARHWKLPKSHMALQSGKTARNKVLRITGDTESLKRRIEDSLGIPGHG